MHPPLSRKELALLTGGKLTVRQIRRNEKRWGLDKARARLSTRMVLYRYLPAIAFLQSFGVEIQVQPGKGSTNVCK